MTSKVIGAAVVEKPPPPFLRSFSSCFLDFFFAFLPPASPPPVGTVNPPRKTSGSRSSIAAGTPAYACRMPDAKREARVTTKTGDRGDTSLFGPGRIRKSDARIEALGDLDETQAAIGVARSTATGTIAATLLDLQRALYVAMSEVGTPASDVGRLPRRIDAMAIAELEEHSASLRATVDI